MSEDLHSADVAVAGGAVGVGVVAIVGASSTDHTAPILAFVGALLVALLTAYSAQRRQREALVAERERLAMQLDHERALKDLEHLRDLLDEASAAYEEAFPHVIDVGLVGVRREPDDEAFLESWERASDAQMRTVVAYRRLLLRVSPEHPLVEAYDAVRQGLLDILVEAHTVRRPFSEEVSAGLKRHRQAAQKAFGEFSDEARALIGVTTD